MNALTRRSVLLRIFLQRLGIVGRSALHIACGGGELGREISSGDGIARRRLLGRRVHASSSPDIVLHAAKVSAAKLDASASADLRFTMLSSSRLPGP